MASHVAWTSLVVAGCLSLGCGREQAPDQKTRDEQAAREKADREFQNGMKMAQKGIGYLQERADEAAQARAKQVEKLDGQIARIQKLFEAGKYDEGELLLVDIHWIPVESGEQQLVQTYDAKREALAKFLESKRAPAR